MTSSAYSQVMLYGLNDRVGPLSYPAQEEAQVEKIFRFFLSFLFFFFSFFSFSFLFLFFFLSLIFSSFLSLSVRRLPT